MEKDCSFHRRQHQESAAENVQDSVAEGKRGLVAKRSVGHSLKELNSRPHEKETWAKHVKKIRLLDVRFDQQEEHAAADNDGEGLFFSTLLV